eukprot:gene54989-47666_t
MARRQRGPSLTVAEQIELLMEGHGAVPTLGADGATPGSDPSLGYSGGTAPPMPTHTRGGVTSL